MLKQFLVLMLAAASALVIKPVRQGDQSESMTRARAIAGLEGCLRRPRDMDCSDLSADFLIREYWRGRGDAAVLKALLDAEPHGNGAMSEGLGDFYATVLEKRPRIFLRAISGRPTKERRSLCSAAGGTDGSGMSDAMLRNVRANLRRISRERGSRLAHVARQCWAEASAADRRAKSQ
jgi:hypothetical protein